MQSKTDLLIIGAGPFGLALAAQASHLGIEHLVVGKPMEFWRQNMPRGMYLRSACDWHLDPQNIHTIENFLQSRGQTPGDVEPLSLEFYLSYAEWFQQQKQITTCRVTSVNSIEPRTLSPRQLTATRFTHATSPSPLASGTSPMFRKS